MSQFEAEMDESRNSKLARCGTGGEETKSDGRGFRDLRKNGVRGRIVVAQVRCSMDEVLEVWEQLE